MAFLSGKISQLMINIESQNEHENLLTNTCALGPSGYQCYKKCLR